MIMGTVVRVHGLGGALRVRSYAESPRSFDQLERVLLCPEEGSERWEGVEWIKPHSKGILLKLDGVNSPETAKLLVGAEIGIDRCDLPDLQDGEYFWTDLIGLTVRTKAGRLIGRVANMFETGANDVIVVEGSLGEVLIPAVETAIEAIDLNAGEIVLTDLAGLVPEEGTGTGDETV